MKQPTRRDFLKPAVAAAISGEAAERAGKRPNIMFALADDWMWPLASIAIQTVWTNPARSVTPMSSSRATATWRLPTSTSGPTKAYLTLHREDPAVRPLYEMAAGKRPERELFDLAKDAFQMRNVAADPKYADVVKRLDARLIAELRATGDPRVEGHGDVFDSYPVRVPPGT